MREEYMNLQKEMMQSEQSPRRKEELAKRQRDLLRKIEDADRDIQRQLNEKSHVVITQIYDEIRSVAEKLTEAKGYDILFAYPDATTPEEMSSPYYKELKLKPPAAHPFVVTKHVDLTEAIIKELNTRYPPKPEIGRRVVE
jgi:Skp family chaperone for outer membrane proteins